MRAGGSLFRLIGLVALTAVALWGIDADAKGMSGGGARASSGGSRSSGYSNSGRSSSFGRSSTPARPSTPTRPSTPSGSSGYSNSGKGTSTTTPSRPATPPPPSSSGSTVKSQPSGASGYGNSAQKSTAGTAARPAPQTALQRKADQAIAKERSAKALADYQAQKAKFKTPEAPINTTTISSTPAFGRMRQSGLPPFSTYYETRRSFYGGYTPPPYMYSSRPSFGMWDALALWFLLDHFQTDRYAAMYYHHADDPAIKEWRQEADRLAQDNADLRAKLAGLDQKVAGMNGTPKDPSYVPDDMKTTVLAPDVAEKVLPEPVAEAALAPMPAAPARQSSHALVYVILVLLLVCGAAWAFRTKRS